MIVEKLEVIAFIGGPLSGQAAGAHRGQFVQGPFDGRYELKTVAYIGSDRTLVRDEYQYNAEWRPVREVA